MIRDSISVKSKKMGWVELAEFFVNDVNGHVEINEAEGSKMLSRGAPNSNYFSSQPVSVAR